MLKTYPAIFHEEADKSYWIEFPEFNGGTTGENLEEAMLMAKDFLANIIAYYIEQDLALPKPTNIHDLQVVDGFTTLIQVDPSSHIKGNKTIRKNVTIPEWLSVKADKNHINYSETLTNALTKKLHLEYDVKLNIREQLTSVILEFILIKHSMNYTSGLEMKIKEILNKKNDQEIPEITINNLVYQIENELALEN